MRTSFPQPEHKKWVVDGSSSMTMTQNISPGQQRSSSKKHIKVMEWPSQSPDLNPRKSVEGAETSSFQETAKKP